MSCTLLSSPLQGFTDFRFRNAFQKYFGGIDTFYAPYIRLNGKMIIKANYDRDIQPKNNDTLTVIPQIMTNDADEFIFVSKFVQSLGYKELNWNLGCPYPMVTNKCMGSGLIDDPDRIDRILDRIHTETDIVVSMKMRMGYEHPLEIIKTFPVLGKYPLKNIAIHARIGKQLYKGGVDLDGFQRCVDHSPHKLYYNGDITTVASFRDMAERFPMIDHWMMGRGLIADPFLPRMIKDQTEEYPEDRFEIFSKFHDTLFSAYEQKLKGDKQVIMKMASFWGYFGRPFPNSAKIINKIKKAKTIESYDLVVAQILENERSYAPSVRYA